MQGTTDPDVLADLARGKLRKKLPALRHALVGRFRPHHAFLVSHLLAHLDYLDEAIETLSTRVDEVIGPFAEEESRTGWSSSARSRCSSSARHESKSSWASASNRRNGRTSGVSSSAPTAPGASAFSRWKISTARARAAASGQRSTLRQGAAPSGHTAS